MNTAYRNNSANVIMQKFLQ